MQATISESKAIVPESGAIAPGGNMPKTHEEFLRQANLKMNEEYDYIEEYNGPNTGILMCHNVPQCGVTFVQTARVHLKDYGCPKCKGNQGSL